MKNIIFCPSDGIPQKDPDSYWHYRFNLMLDATSTMEGFLERLVDYRQKRKLTQFLLHCCEHLEITYDRYTGALQDYLFQIEFSDQITLQYSNHIEECRVFLDGKKDSFPTLLPEIGESMSEILAQIWESTRTLPIWEMVSEDLYTVCVSRLS